MTGATVTDKPGLLATEADRSLLLHAEEVSVSKRVHRTLVRAALTTALREQVVDVDLERVQAVVERVPIGRIVDAVPPIRTEDGVTIFPVVEEEVVLVRRLILKEEVRLRTVRSVSRHVETVTLREQDVAVTRTALED